MSNPIIHEKEGSLDDFIDNLVSAPHQPPNTYRLISEDTNLDTTFNILVEIFTKVIQL